MAVINMPLPHCKPGWHRSDCNIVGCGGCEGDIHVEQLTSGSDYLWMPKTDEGTHWCNEWLNQEEHKKYYGGWMIKAHRTDSLVLDAERDGLKVRMHNLRMT